MRILLLLLVALGAIQWVRWVNARDEKANQIHACSIRNRNEGVRSLREATSMCGSSQP